MRRFLDRELIACRADAVVAVSRKDRRKMADVDGIPERKLRFIANGIPDPAPPGATDVSAELGMPADAPVIGVYMEAALPVVATAVGGLPDMVEDGVTGLLVPPRDPVAFAKAVTTLLDDRELAVRMGDAGRKRRRSEFSIDGTTRAVEDLYKELYAAKTAVRATR